MTAHATEIASWRNLDRALGPDCLRIASYNIHRCVGTDGREDVARIAQVIRETCCDTIGLQEVSSSHDGQRDTLQLDYLTEATGMKAFAGETMVRHGRVFGNAILTRRPVLDVRRHVLTYEGREPRGALEVDLDVAGRMVRVMVTHLGLRPAERRFQVKKMLQLLHDIPHTDPVVVLGDINEWLPLGRPLRWLHGMLGHAPYERSFPSFLPLFALDRVWVRPRHDLLAFGVHRSPLSRVASDHLPVKAIVAVEQHALHRQSAPIAPASRVAADEEPTW